MKPKNMFHLFTCYVIIFTCIGAKVTGLLQKGEILFLDAIKQNLRKNNDDYIDIVRSSVSTINSTFSLTLSNVTKTNSTTSSIRSTTKQAAQNASSSIPEGINRRSNKGVSVLLHTNLTPVQPIPQKLKAKFATTSKTLSTAKRKTNTVLSRTARRPTTPKLLTISKVLSTATKKQLSKEKLMKLDNINLLMQRMQASSKWTKRFKIKKKPQSIDELKEQRLSEVSSKIKPISRGSNKEMLRSGQLPSPEILDMAAAKGSRINSKRLKGRLCHRHVLVPEGPKYDSAGRVYLRAHAGPRGYGTTRRPDLLLPACCNCCRKSVLGCE